MYSKSCFILSFKDNLNHHHVLFMATREFAVSYSRPLAHWYDEEVTLHSVDQIYGWSCFGRSEQVDEILNGINQKGILNINGRIINIAQSMPVVNSIVLESENAISGLPSIIDSYKIQHHNTSESEWMKHAGAKCRDLMEKPFCDHISGIKKWSHEYGSMRLAGHWSDGELHSYFHKHVVFVEESLIPSISFRGTGNIESKIIDGFAGLCENFPLDQKKVQIQLLDIDTSEILATEDATLLNGWGQWEIKLPNAPAKGIVRAIIAENVIGANKFFLLMNISVDVKAVGGGPHYQDFYGRKMSTEKVNREGAPPSGINWKSDYSKKPSILSDDLKGLISFMGQKVLIQDPYFIGIVEDGVQITEGSKSFLNALASCVVNHDLTEISILIDNKKLKLNPEKKLKLKDALRKTFDPLKKFGLKSLSLHYAKNAFHDRYYLGLDDNQILYHVSKSISGYLEPDDLNIFQYSGDQKKQLVSQIRYRLEQSDKEVVIE